MGRLAKTGLALVGLAAIGGFVSLLGGPNVFSTFSNAISILFPESELAVEKTEEKQTQDQVPTPPTPEETKELGVDQKLPEQQEISATPQAQETPQPAPVIARKVEVPAPTPKSILQSPTPRAATSASGGEEFGAPSRTQGSGSEGSGIFCSTVGRNSFMMKKGEICGGWTFNGQKLAMANQY